jgi:hypothetical protein
MASLTLKKNPSMRKLEIALKHQTMRQSEVEKVKKEQSKKQCLLQCLLGLLVVAIPV